jgi:hypothetical protein
LIIYQHAAHLVICIGQSMLISFVVEVLNKLTGDFTDKDIDFVSAFTTFASVALQNSRIQNV